MFPSTRVFISATSGDLSATRQLVKEALLSINCHPIEQTNFPPDYRTVHAMLEERIASCQAVIHLAGYRYGAEPDPTHLPPDTPRRSYTQMEYDLARQLNKKLYVFLCPEDFLYGPYATESADRQALQQAHRAAILADAQLYTQIATREELEKKVRELDVEMQGLRQQVHQIARYGLIGTIVLVAILLGISYGVYHTIVVVQQGKQQIEEQNAQAKKLYEHPEQLAPLLREHIRRKADEARQTAHDRGAKWEEIRELERRRDLALAQVDELIRSIRQGLADQANPVFLDASRILAIEGVDAALGYLASHRLGTLAWAEQLAALEAQARQKKRQALESLLLEADLHKTNLAWDRALEQYETIVAIAPEWSRARSQLGDLLVELARYDDAEPHLQAALRNAQDDQDRARARASSLLGDLYNSTAKWEQAESRYRRALALWEQVHDEEHPDIASTLISLATLLWNTNRLDEADLLLRRALAIFQRFQQRTGYEHPYHQKALSNYRRVLENMERTPEEIEQQVQEALETPGALAPITPEVEKLLGPSKPVEAILEALDAQHRQASTPAVWFLSPDQPITPHLEELLGASQLDVPLEQPIVPHLEKLLGPATATQEVLDALDRQYREQGKPAVWFLPHDQPLSPHLDTLLGPVKAGQQAQGTSP